MENNPAKMQMFQMFAQDQQENENFLCVFPQKTENVWKKQGSAYEKGGNWYFLSSAPDFQLSNFRRLLVKAVTLIINNRNIGCRFPVNAK